jgi:hypothetical protein
MTLAPLPASAQSAPGKVVLYAGLGSELIQYDVDVERATLTKRGSVTLPAMAGGVAHPRSRSYMA